jgi:hypothetical protein
MLGIKYSTAKTLIRNYSHTFHTHDPHLVKLACLELCPLNRADIRCGYAPIADGGRLREEGRGPGEDGGRGGNKIEIISSIFPPKEN